MANEKRLIDANALKKALRTDSGADAMGHSVVRLIKTDKIIDEQPTVDAVDCLQYEEIVNKLECLLCHATGGQYSKAGYALEDMERMVTDYIEECCEEAVAEEVVHGRWILREDGYHCSNCDIQAIYTGVKLNYCPNCGAKMDREEET